MVPSSVPRGSHKEKVLADTIVAAGFPDQSSSPLPLSLSRPLSFYLPPCQHFSDFETSSQETKDDVKIDFKLPELQISCLRMKCCCQSKIKEFRRKIPQNLYWKNKKKSIQTNVKLEIFSPWLAMPPSVTDAKHTLKLKACNRCLHLHLMELNSTRLMTKPVVYVIILN